MASSRLRRRTAAVAAAALLLAGCGPSEEELRATALRDAVEATFADTFAFGLTLDVDEAALVDLEEAAGPLSTLLASVELDGVVDGDRLGVSLELLDLDVLELRVVGGQPYVRSDLTGIVSLLGQPSEVAAVVASRLEEAGTAPDVVAAAVAVVRGDWVMLETDATFEDGQLTPGASVGGAFRGLLEAATVTDAIGVIDEDDPFDGQLTVSVDLAVARDAINGVLAGLDVAQIADDVLSPDETPAGLVRGRVLVLGGLITSVSLDLGTALARANGRPAGGNLTVLLELDDHGDVAPIEPPDGATGLSVADLEAAISAIGAALGPDALAGLTGPDAP